jgi:hypothetical protein
VEPDFNHGNERKGVNVNASDILSLYCTTTVINQTNPIPDHLPAKNQGGTPDRFAKRKGKENFVRGTEIDGWIVKKA